MDPTDDAVAAARPGFVVSLAAATQALGGVTTVLSGVQIVDVRFIEPLLDLLPYLMILLGVALTVIAPFVYRTRPWAAVVGALLAAVTALVANGWFIFASFSGVYSIMSLLAASGTVAAAVLGVLAIGPCRRAAAARRRLADEGIRLGL